MRKSIGIIIGLVAIVLFGLSFFLENMLLFFLGILLLLIGVFVTITSMVVDLYQKDKMIDYELVKKSGLTLVHCPQCNKENIKEDIYCIFCGERLEKDEI